MSQSTLPRVTVRRIATRLTSATVALLAAVLIANAAAAGTMTVKEPKKDGEITVLVFICADAKCRHGIPVKKTIAIKGNWSKERKAREIRDKMKADVKRNGGTITAAGATVTVTNNRAGFDATIEMTKDSTGECDEVEASHQGDPTGDPENLSYQTRARLTGVTTSGMATLGQDGVNATVPTDGLSINDIYLSWQSVFGGTIQSDGLVLPPTLHSSTAAFNTSFMYEVTDPGLEIQINQNPLFDWRDLIGTDLRLTLTDQGTLGFMDNSQEAGTGLVFPNGGPNHLFTGGIWLGLNPGDILNRDFDEEPSPDWSVSLDPVGYPTYDQVGSLGQEVKTILESLSLDGTGYVAEVRASSYSLGDAPSDFVILDVRTTCEGPGAVVGAYSGLLFDMDVMGTYDDDYGSVLPASGLVWMSSSEPGAAYVGLAVLSTGDGCAPELLTRASLIPNQVYVWPNGHVPDPDKWGFLSGAGPQYQILDAPVPDDYSMIASAGPFDLVPGESRQVSYVLAAGNTLAELQASVDVARSIVCSGGMIPADAPEDVQELAASLQVSAHPNPARGAVQLSYQMTQSGRVAVDLFDSNGRRVRSFEQRGASAGAQTVPWDGRDDRGNLVPAGTYFARVRTPDGVGTVQVTLIR